MVIMNENLIRLYLYILALFDLKAGIIKNSIELEGQMAKYVNASSSWRYFLIQIKNHPVMANSSDINSYIFFQPKYLTEKRMKDFLQKFEIFDQLKQFDFNCLSMHINMIMALSGVISEMFDHTKETTSEYLKIAIHKASHI